MKVSFEGIDFFSFVSEDNKRINFFFREKIKKNVFIFFLLLKYFETYVKKCALFEARKQHLQFCVCLSRNHS